jgi:hypothetical protein
MTLRVRAVSDEETEELARMARSRTLGAGLVRRAQIVLHGVTLKNGPESTLRYEGQKSGRPWLMGLCGAGMDPI